MDEDEIGRDFLDIRASYKNNQRCVYPVCDCEIDKADRGWFYRTHKYCGTDAVSCVGGEDHFVIIMIYAIVCGVLWIAASGIALIASIKMERTWIWISASLFLAGYALFIGLFGTIMVDLNYNRRLINNSSAKPVGTGYEKCCPAEKDKFKRSSDEFLAYSICSFVLIGISIILTLISLG